MANVFRRTRHNGISPVFTLATADDVDGTTDGSQYLSVKAGERVLIAQVADGTPGTLGIDVIEVSIGGGAFVLDPTLLAVASADQGGTNVTALNTAGTEPTGAAIFKSGPFARDVKMRCGRKTTTTGGTTWSTGAPSVLAFLIERSS